MADILIIGWLIAGVLSVIFSGFLYYNEIITQESFLAILLLGIVILISNITFMLSWEGKGGKGKTWNDYSKALSNRFLLLLALSIIIFGIGLFGYLLTMMDMYDIDSQPTFLVLFIAGLLGTLGSFLSWKYGEVNILNIIKNTLSVEDRNMDSLLKDIERDHKNPKENNVNDLLEEAVKLKNRAIEEIVEDK